jgi:hypothetical protein
METAMTFDTAWHENPLTGGKTLNAAIEPKASPPPFDGSVRRIQFYAFIVTFD